MKNPEQAIAIAMHEAGTLQKRLPQEPRLAGIGDMQAASRFLKEEFLPRHNARFSVGPKGEGSAFVPFAGSLEDILCVQEERAVAADNTVRDKTRTLQIPADRHVIPKPVSSIYYRQPAHKELHFYATSNGRREG